MTTRATDSGARTWQDRNELKTRAQTGQERFTPAELKELGFCAVEIRPGVGCVRCVAHTGAHEARED